MKLEAYKQAYEDPSGKASDIARYLGITGIAIIWLFREQGIEQQTIPNDLRWPALLIVAGLAADLFGYAVSAVIYWQYYRYKEKQNVDKNAPLDGPVAFTWFGWIPWFLKIGLIITAYILLFKFLWYKLG